MQQLESRCPDCAAFARMTGRRTFHERHVNSGPFICGIVKVNCLFAATDTLIL